MALMRELNQGEPKGPRPHLYRAPLPFRHEKAVVIPEVIPSPAEIISHISDYSIKALETAEMLRLERRINKKDGLTVRPAHVRTIDILRNDTGPDTDFRIKYTPNDADDNGVRRTTIDFIFVTSADGSVHYEVEAERIESPIEAKYATHPTPEGSAVTKNELAQIWKIIQDPEVIREIAYLPKRSRNNTARIESQDMAADK